MQEMPEPAANGASLIGRHVGRYRVVEEIGRGGMGVVYRAVHEGIGQLAAVKVLAPRCADDPAYLRRFTDEARAASRVDHPGLAKIFDHGQLPGGVPFILMELLLGELLRARLERLRAAERRMSVAEARRIARQAASALAAAHERGVVHRDLKPENLMLVPDEEAAGGERVKILDFGIARFTDEGRRTTEGKVLGTGAYMSPEQCVGAEEIDGRADVYALGVTTYEMLAGAPPFRGDFLALLRSHVDADPPPLARARPDAPPELVALVHRMLAKEPSQRPEMSRLVELLRAGEAAPTEEEEAALEHAPTVEAALPRGATTVAATRTKEAKPGGDPEAETRRTGPPTRAASEPPAPASRPWWRRAAPLLAAVPLALGAAQLVRSQRAEKPRFAMSGMAWIAGAKLRMGSAPEEVEAACRALGAACQREILDREQPPREVTVSGFFLDVTEVDNAAFAAWLDTRLGLLQVRDDRDERWPRFVVDLPSGKDLADLYPEHGGVERTPDGHFRARGGREHLPVVQVTWDGASLYCRARGMRLPTEAEWELAARGPGRRRFPWGDGPPRCEGVVLLRDKGDPCERLGARPAPVGSAPDDRTPEGVRDLGGNVAEWVEDAFLLPHYPECGGCVDPVVEPREPGGEDFRIRRGGAFRTDELFARGTARGRWKRGAVQDGLGFRCAAR